jgi:hypothetical protein
VDQLIVQLPEYKDEQYEKGEEHGDIVHGAQHNEQLSSEVGHESHQFQYPQEAKRT